MQSREIKKLTNGEHQMIDRAVKWIRCVNKEDPPKDGYLVSVQLYNDLVFFEAYSCTYDGARHRGYGLRYNGRMTMNAKPVKIDPRRWDTCQECGEAFVMQGEEYLCRSCSGWWGRLKKWFASVCYAILK